MTKMAAIMERKRDILFLQSMFIFVLSVTHFGQSAQQMQRKTHDMIYFDVHSFSPCVRRFNATHQIGCTSEFNGNNGVIHAIKESADLEWLLVNGTYSPYIALMTPVMFDLENVQQLLKSGKVNGILVDHSNVSTMIDEEKFFSPDKTCPNENFGIYSESKKYSNCKRVKWNSVGNGMSFMDLRIPIFALMDPEEVSFLFECYETHNRPDSEGRARPFPQCAGEMNDFMFGAKDTPTCIWRTKRYTSLQMSVYCDPLEDFNVWGTLLPTNKSSPLEEDSLIVAAAQLDSSSIFYGVWPMPGAENAISGFVTLLAAAEALGSLPPEVKNKMTNIMFTFFQGESYDYIGSSRMVYDMARGRFPTKPDEKKQQPSNVNLTTIAAFLEVRQLALANQSTYYAHVDPLSQADPDTRAKTAEIIGNLTEAATNTSIMVSEAPEGQPLPPASFQQFLRNRMNIPGVVLTDHRAEYHNKYFNSRLDVPELFGINYTEYNTTDELPIFEVAQSLTDVATTLARTLYLLALPTATDAEDLAADEELVNDLLFCFSQRPNCSRIREVVPEQSAKTLPNVAYDFYVGVKNSNSYLSSLVDYLLSYYLGERTPMSDDDSKDKCSADKDDEIFMYDFVRGPHHNDSNGVCVKSTVHKSIALSPAFDGDNPDWGSTVYSTWTESQWSSYNVRVFLKPSRSQETITFSVGVIVILISLSSTYLLSKRITDLFP